MRNFNQEENQGKTEKQINNSYKLVFYSVIGLFIVVFLSIIENILNG
jgi:hypothetical protein